MAKMVGLCTGHYYCARYFTSANNTEMDLLSSNSAVTSVEDFTLRVTLHIQWTPVPMH